MHDFLFFREILNKRNLKNTRQRRAILKLMFTEDIPLSAKEIYYKIKDNNPHLKLSTIYRNLNVFEKNNIVRKLNINNGKKSYFELIKDEHHHHLICIRCGQIQDIECPFDGYLDKLEKKKNYEVTDHRLTVYGICHECKKDDK